MVCLIRRLLLTAGTVLTLAFFSLSLTACACNMEDNNADMPSTTSDTTMTTQATSPIEEIIPDDLIPDGNATPDDATPDDGMLPDNVTDDGGNVADDFAVTPSDDAVDNKRYHRNTSTHAASDTAKNDDYSDNGIRRLCALIGKNSDQLTDALGKGTDNYETRGGKKTLAGREFNCSLYGTKMPTTVTLSDKGKVREINIGVKNGSVTSWQAKIAKELGSASKVSRDGNNYDYRADWNCGTAQVTLSEFADKVSIRIA